MVLETTRPKRCRVRALLPNLHLGGYAPGPKNSLTDVPGVLVHTKSIHLPPSEAGTHKPINTGITTILPRPQTDGAFLHNACYAGLFRLNGNGELTGSHWIAETGLLNSPIVLTNSYSIGEAYTGVYRWCIEHFPEDADTVLPVVGETFDGICSDISGAALVGAVKAEDVVRGIDEACSDAVEEGNTGGGTGNVCHGVKGGTGSASRIVPGVDGVEYTLGVLVQANYGRLRDLRIGGAPIGRQIWNDTLQDVATVKEAEAMAHVDSQKDKKDGSIIIILATSAPLHPLQLQRLAKRATMGLARVGGNGHNPSGDIFLAFSTGNAIPVTTEGVDIWKPKPLDVKVLDDRSINGLFDAAADAVEEAILNALFMAEPMVGVDGELVDALSLEKVKSMMEKY
ncbi:peptidase family T4 protein, partial [Mycena amicta]